MRNWRQYETLRTCVDISVTCRPRERQLSTDQRTNGRIVDPVTEPWRASLRLRCFFDFASWYRWSLPSSTSMALQKWFPTHDCCHMEFLYVFVASRWRAGIPDPYPSICFKIWVPGPPHASRFGEGPRPQSPSLQRSTGSCTSLFRVPCWSYPSRNICGRDSDGNQFSAWSDGKPMEVSMGLPPVIHSRSGFSMK